MPSRTLNPTRSDQFCQRTSWPSTVNETPSGWLISSGFAAAGDAPCSASGTSRGTYSPMTAGRSGTATSSISSSSMAFRSMTQCSPLTGPA